MIKQLKKRKGKKAIREGGRKIGGKERGKRREERGRKKMDR